MKGVAALSMRAIRWRGRSLEDAIFLIEHRRRGRGRRRMWFEGVSFPLFRKLTPSPVCVAGCAANSILDDQRKSQKLKIPCRNTRSSVQNFENLPRRRCERVRADATLSRRARISLLLSTLQPSPPPFSSPLRPKMEASTSSSYPMFSTGKYIKEGDIVIMQLVSSLLPCFCELELKADP